MLCTELSSRLNAITTSSDEEMPQIRALEAFIRQYTDKEVSWLDFVNFLGNSQYQELFFEADPFAGLSSDVVLLFKEFYLTYPAPEWQESLRHEIDCFYPGNLEPVAEQESLYTSAVTYTPARAKYSTPNHLPVLYSTHQDSFIDRGPQAHSAQPIAPNSLSSCNPFYLGLRFFCDKRRENKKVTVTFDPNEEVSSDPLYYVPQFWRMSLGQESDIRCHQQRVALAMTDAPEETSILLYGVSRGAATTFTSLAHAYKQENFKTSIFAKVTGVILEAPFNQVAGELENPLYFNSSIIPRIMEHDPDGISPANQVEYFPPDIPVLFISSKVDKRVPLASTRRLAEQLAQRGQNPVYLLILEFSEHPEYPYAHPYDRQKYLTSVHAFRRFCHLSHDTKLADAGREYLDDSCLHHLDHNTEAPIASI